MPRTVPKPIMSSVLADVSCRVAQCARCADRRAAAVAAVRSASNRARIRRSASRPARSNSTHSSRARTASTTIQPPPPAKTPSHTVSPGDIAAPATNAAHTATVAAAAAGTPSWNWTATTVNDAIGDTQPNDAICCPGSTRTGLARHRPQTRTTSTAQTARYRRQERPSGSSAARYTRFHTTTADAAATANTGPRGGRENGLATAQSTPTAARPTAG